MKKILMILLSLSLLANLSGCNSIFKNEGNDVGSIGMISGSDGEVKTNSDEDSSDNISATEQNGSSIDKDVQTTESHTLKLYFSDEQAEYVVLEERTVQVDKGSQLEKIVFEELVKGSKKGGSSSVIPKGTKLLSVNTKNGTCTLDLSKEFFDNHAGGTAGEIMTLYSIVNSLTELPNVERVQFLIEGKVSEVYIHASLDTPIERDEDIIKNINS